MTLAKPRTVVPWFSKEGSTHEAAVHAASPVALILLVPARRSVLADLPQSSVSLQAQAPCSPARVSPDLAKFLYVLSTFVS